MYLFHTEFNSSGAIITIEEQDIDKFIEENVYKHDKTTKTLLTDEDLLALSLKYEKQVLDYRTELINQIKKSSLLRKYSDIVVPEDWKSKLEKEDLEIEAKQTIASLSPAELRKLNEKTIVNSFKSFSNKPYSLEQLSRSKKEPKISELLNDPAEIIYGDSDDEEKLKSACFLLYSQLNTSHRYLDTYTDSFKLILVANANKKYVKTKTHINTFFKELDNNNIMTMNDKLIKWYTGKLINDNYDKFKFINSCYKSINSEVVEIHDELTSYVKNYYSNSVKNDFIDDWLVFTDNAFKMQLFVTENPNIPEQELKNKSMELFGAEIVKGGNVVDLEIYYKLQWLINYCEPIYPLFNEVRALEYGFADKKELESLINEIISLKGLNNYTFVSNKEIIADVVEEQEVEIV